MPTAQSPAPKGDPKRRAADADSARLPGPAEIRDAVSDQLGGHWIRYGSETRSVWFSLQQLQQEPRIVFSRLSSPGMTFLTNSSQNAFKALIEKHASFRPALVAEHPGWTDGHYAFGNGEISSPPDDDREVIIGFEPDSKFAARGSLEGWKDAVHPLIAGQSLPLFALSYSFIGALLRFAPPDMLNPIIELVGGSGTGKTTLGILASSVWGGQLGSDVGSGHSWDLTLDALDNVKRAHRDGHLTLDEGNLLGSNPLKQRELIQSATFKLATTESKRRYYDTGPQEHVRLATLSTTNLPLAELVNAHASVRGALAQRMITISADGDHGVLDQIPDGFESAAKAIEELRGALDANFGVAGREFIRRLVRVASKREGDIRAFIQAKTTNYREWADEASARTSPRVSKAFAMAYAAGRLAQKCGLIPGDHRNLLHAILCIHESVQILPATSSGQDSLRRVRAYAQKNWDDLIPADNLPAPLSETEFGEAIGFWRSVENGTELLVSSSRFQKIFPDFQPLMHALRQQGAARTEGGRTPKLTIKAPNKIARSGRVYCIRLHESPSDLRRAASASRQS